MRWWGRDGERGGPWPITVQGDIELDLTDGVLIRHQGEGWGEDHALRGGGNWRAGDAGRRTDGRVRDAQAVINRIALTWVHGETVAHLGALPRRKGARPHD